MTSPAWTDYRVCLWVSIYWALTKRRDPSRTIVLVLHNNPQQKVFSFSSLCTCWNCVHHVKAPQFWQTQVHLPETLSAEQHVVQFGKRTRSVHSGDLVLCPRWEWYVQPTNVNSRKLWTLNRKFTCLFVLGAVWGGLFCFVLSNCRWS